jgi:hypothetical protein
MHCWYIGWQKVGWLEGWLAVARVGLEAGWPPGFPGALGIRFGGADPLVWGATTNTFILKPIPYQQWTRD